MNTNSKLKQASLYGLLASVPLLIVLAIRVFSGQYLNGQILGLIDNAVFIFGIFFIIKHYRNVVCGGSVTLGECVKMGTLSSLMVGIVIGFALFLIFKFDAKMSEAVLRTVRNVYASVGIPKSDVEQIMSTLKSLLPVTQFIGALISNVIGGLFVSLICGAFLRNRSGNGFDEAMKEVE